MGVYLVNSDEIWGFFILLILVSPSGIELCDRINMPPSFYKKKKKNKKEIKDLGGKVKTTRFLITKILCRTTDRIIKGSYFLKLIMCKLCKIWGFHSGVGEVPSLLGPYAVLPGKQWLTYQRSVLQFD